MRCPSLSELPPPPPGRSGWPWTEATPSLPEQQADGRPWPRVSIVTPSFNQARFLEEAIRSVLLQGYPHLEYVILDGGSRDGSREIIEKYAPWLAYWVSQPDKGQADAVAQGFWMAKGDLVGWINSDDLYLPGMFGAAAGYLSSHPDAAVAYSACNWVDEHSHILGRVQEVDFRLNEYLYSDTIPQQTVLIRRSALEAVGGIDPTLHSVLDYDLFLRLGLRYPLKRIAGAGGCFRIYGGTKSTGKPETFWQENLVIFERLFSSPHLPPEIHCQKNAVFARIYLRGACREFGTRQIENGQKMLTKAFELEPSLLTDFNRTVDLLSGWSSNPVVGNPHEYLETVFNHLPESATLLRQKRHQALGRGYMGLVFRAYHRKDFAAVRQALPRALRHDPTWLSNRGVLSIVWQAARQALLQRFSPRQHARGNHAQG